MSKKGLRLLAGSVAVAGALAVATPSPALAATSPANGCANITQTTTLSYTDPHGNFNLRVWVSNWGWFTSNQYTIRMYNSSGTQVWSAANQVDRTYVIGGNVTKVTVYRYSFQGTDTCWRRS